MKAEELNLATLSHLFTDEEAARKFLEANRWPNGVTCPHCSTLDVTPINSKPGSKTRPGVFQCKGCRQQFTVRIGTIFEDSKLPLSKWLMAYHLMTSSKKGVSSHQIARELGITVKSAWFVTHRIRESMKKEPLAGMLKGTVEVDETYVGGKPRVKNSGKRGRGTKKTPVMVLVERDGNARALPLDRVTMKNLKGQIEASVAQDATVMTDEYEPYKGVRKDGSHRRVKHSAKEYSRVDPDGVNVNTNTAESFFALLKRGHYGIFHQLSKKHLHRYCEEFGFRWDHRKVTDGERMVAAIAGAEGKRLMYREPLRGLVS